MGKRPALKEDTWNRDRPVSRVFRNIMLISRSYKDAMDELALNNGLQTGEFMVLMTLLRAGGNDGLTPTKLYNELLVASGTITKRVDRLAQLGLIERITSQKDRRSSTIRLTNKGRDKAEGIRRQSNRLHNFAEIFGSDKIDELDVILQQYLAAIEEFDAQVQDGSSQ